MVVVRTSTWTIIKR